METFEKQKLELEDKFMKVLTPTPTPTPSPYLINSLKGKTTTEVGPRALASWNWDEVVDGKVRSSPSIEGAWAREG